MNKIIGFIIIVISLASCTKPLFDNGFVRYSTNSHYVVHQQIPELNDYVKISFIPNNTWYYETENNGWSKIFGYSDGDHRKNSNRIGFKCVDDKLYVGYYIYVNGVTPQQNTEQKGVMLEVFPNETYTAELYRSGINYCVKIYNNDTLVYKEYPARQNGIGYLLFPYIGGQYTIKDFYIDLKIH